uniref:CDT1 domain-containing protein n=1 Tax=Macrostomum lignano TaxID=282301 RepID=A0A1I8F940_9PLAT
GKDLTWPRLLPSRTRGTRQSRNGQAADPRFQLSSCAYRRTALPFSCCWRPRSPDQRAHSAGEAAAEGRLHGVSSTSPSISSSGSMWSAVLRPPRTKILAEVSEVEAALAADRRPEAAVRAPSDRPGRGSGAVPRAASSGLESPRLRAFKPPIHLCRRWPPLSRTDSDTIVDDLERLRHHREAWPHPAEQGEAAGPGFTSNGIGCRVRRLSEHPDAQLIDCLESTTRAASCCGCGGNRRLRLRWLHRLDKLAGLSQAALLPVSLADFLVDYNARTPLFARLRRDYEEVAEGGLRRPRPAVLAALCAASPSPVVQRGRRWSSASTAVGGSCWTRHCCNHVGPPQPLTTPRTTSLPPGGSVSALSADRPASAARSCPAWTPDASGALGESTGGQSRLICELDHCCCLPWRWNETRPGPEAAALDFELASQERREAGSQDSTGWPTMSMRVTRVRARN